MEALLLLISNYKQDKVCGTCAGAGAAAAANRGWDGTGPGRLMDADGVLLPHLAACFQDKLCYLFSCLVIYLKGDSPLPLLLQVAWLILLMPAFASKASHS